MEVRGPRVTPEAVLLHVWLGAYPGGQIAQGRSRGSVPARARDRGGGRVRRRLGPLDSGFNPELIRDPVKRAENYVNPSYIGVMPPGDPLVDQVALAGLEWSQLAFCVMSHLHCDHSGGLRLLADGPPVVLQQPEFDFAMHEATVQNAYFRTDYARDDLNWKLIEGEYELAEGFRVIPTPGHTPGHMSFAVDLRVAGTVVLACDAADLRGNIDAVIPCGTTTHASLEPSAQRSIELLHVLDSQDGVSVWPGHDPDFWPTRRKPPSSYV